MKWPLTNWILAPVFTLSIACSLAKVEVSSPKLAQKMSAPCPFHSQQETQSSESPAPSSAPSNDKSSCPNCLTSSVRSEEPTQAQSVLAVNDFLPEAQLMAHVAEWPGSSAFSSYMDYFSGPPPRNILPLRI